MVGFSTLLLALSLLPPPASAQESGAEAVSFQRALQLAEGHPRAAGLARAADTKRRVDQGISRFTGNPQLSGSLGYRFGRPEVAEVEGELGASQGFNLAGLSGLRKQGARQEEEELAAYAQAARIDAQLAAAQAWCTLWAAEQALENAQEEATLAAQFAGKIGRAAQAAELTQVDVSEAQAYVAEAQLNVLSAEGDLFEAGVAFARALGVEPRAIRTDGALPQMPVPPHEWRDVLLTKVDLLPSVQARREAVEAERTRERELAASRGAHVQLGVLGVRDQPESVVALGTAIFQLPAYDLGARERGVAAAEADRLQGEWIAAQAEARGFLTLALHEVDHTQEVLQQVSDAALPAAELALRQRERLFEVGEGRVLDVLLAKRAVVAMRTRSAQARAARAFAGARLELLAHEVGLTSPPAKETP